MPTFHSILFAEPPAVDVAEMGPPGCFGDLHLHQVVGSMTEGRAEYDLPVFFSLAADGEDAIAYRHEELARMSGIADHVRPGAPPLCNESFASTNERSTFRLREGEPLPTSFGADLQERILGASLAPHAG